MRVKILIIFIIILKITSGIEVKFNKKTVTYAVDCDGKPFSATVEKLKHECDST